MRVILFVCLSVLVCVASARTITWTGAAGNSLWGFANNWDANAVPTSADDVVINPLGGATISVSSPAAANSITIGGGTYNQVLNLLSSLAVGPGGIVVRSGGTLQVSSNNDLPLSSTGPVHIAGGGALVWASGDVTGPGQYTVDYGAGLVFNGPALKLVDKVNITVRGQATIQPTTIQFARGGSLYLLGNTTVIGQVTIFQTDNTPNLLFVNGNFTYQGTTTNAPLNFQVNTTFNSALNIVTGGVIISAQASFNGNTNVPQGTTVTVQAGLNGVYFRSVSGAGSFFVNSIATVVTLSTSVVNIAASGSLTTTAAGSVKSLVVGGKLILASGTLSTTDVSVQAGTVTGAGRLVASGNTELTAATTGNNNVFISAEIAVQGHGYTTGSNNVLFADAGNLHVTSTGTFTISASTSFAKQTGNPVVTNEGTFTVSLPIGSVFTTAVDYRGGAGVLNLNGGLVNFQGDTSIANKVTTTNVLIQFQTATANWGPVSGTGSINVTAAPTATSSFGQTQISYFGVVNGNVNVTSLSVATLELFNAGILSVGSGSHSATIFNLYGGTLNGRASLTTSQFVMTAQNPVTLNSIAITAKQYKFSPYGPSANVQSQNYATISVGF